tara:strand:- start:6256 stop:7155 length:900 start_codon:yes stop_codon:yes gene_type:complete
MNINKKKLIMIVGPTASGKTEASILISKIFNCDIISADSRQFYKEMSIGTAKPSKKDLYEVSHHFINNISVKDKYSSGIFSKEVNEFLSKYFLENDYVIVVGGSGLFIDSIIYGFDDLPSVPESFRIKLNKIYKKKGLSHLLNRLKVYDPKYLEIVDKKNYRRVIRALEVSQYTNKPYSSYLTNKKKKLKNYSIEWYGLFPTKEKLRSRINKRVDDMIKMGLFDEVKNLKKFKELNPLKSVGYTEVFSYLEGEISKKEAIDLIKINSWKYSKRQMTWFKKNKEIKWYRSIGGLINSFKN